MAGYRAGFVTGDPALVRDLLEVRRHAGMMVPAPVQAAMAAALDDDDHVERQRARYAARRQVLLTALEAAGWKAEHSEAGLYLWVSHPARDCWESARVLAGAGILATPGQVYGPLGERHVRFSLTATDERIKTAAQRLRGLKAQLPCDYRRPVLVQRLAATAVHASPLGPGRRCDGHLWMARGRLWTTPLAGVDPCAVRRTLVG